MRLPERFRAAVLASQAALPAPELLPERLARACAAVLPVYGAGVSLMHLDRRLPLGASDDVSAEAERLQFTVGQGPCLEAHASGIPVIADEATLRVAWPAYYDGLVTRTPIRGVIALPLQGGGLDGLGALDLYITPPASIGSVTLADAVDVAREVVSAFDEASRLTPRSENGPYWLDAPGVGKRAAVWEAMGFLNAGLGVSSPDALALLRAHAYSQGRTVDEIAALVTSRQLPLTELAVDATDR